VDARASAEKFSGGNEKKTENSTIKPFSTISGPSAARFRRPCGGRKVVS